MGARNTEIKYIGGDSGLFSNCTPLPILGPLIPDAPHEVVIESHVDALNHIGSQV